MEKKEKRIKRSNIINIYQKVYKLLYNDKKRRGKYIRTLGCNSPKIRGIKVICLTDISKS